MAQLLRSLDHTLSLPTSLADKAGQPRKGTCPVCVLLSLDRFLLLLWFLPNVEG